MQKFIIVIVLVITGCSPTKDSVYTEKIPATILADKNRFDTDNIVYPVGKTFKYDFTLLDKEGAVITTDTKYIKLYIQGGTEPFSRIDPDYSQTVIKFTYLNKNGIETMTEKTGVIENDKNIWMHPPRSQETAILQMSAFPYIKFDNKKWKWNLVASFNGYERINLNHSYVKKKSIDYESPLGTLKCDVVEAETESSIGTTHSYFLYNNQYGFVYLKFINFDGTTIILNLIQNK